MDELEQYVQEHKEKDDLEQYVKDHYTPSEPKTSAVRAAIDHAGDQILMGHLATYKALIDKALGNPNSDLDAKLKEQGFKITQPEDKTYVQNRDDYAKELEEQKKEHPYASAAGSVAGFGLGAYGLGKVLPSAGAATLGETAGGEAIIGPVTQGSQRLANLAHAAKTGAVVGALQNPGYKEGDIDAIDEIKGRSQGAGIGAFAGPVGELASEGVSLGANKIKDILTKWANLKATRALGRSTPTATQKMMESGQDETIGRSMLDEGVLPFFSTPGRIKSKVDVLKNEAGKEVGNIIDKASDEMASQEASGTAPFGGYRRKGTEITASPLEDIKVTYGNPDTQYIPITPPEMPKAKYKSGKLAHLNDEANLKKLSESGFNEFEPNPEVQVSSIDRKLKFGEPEVVGNRLEPKSAYRIDAESLADKFRNSEDIKALAKTPGMESSVGTVSNILDTLAKNGEELSLKDALKLRQNIDRSINFAKSNESMKGAQEVLYNIRDALREKMNEAVNKASVAEKDALLGANMRYHKLTTMDDILNRELARDQGNRSISLTDSLAAAGEIAAGKPGLAGLAAMANKGVRTFGDSVMAHTYDATANQLAKIPRFAEMAQKNPQAFSQLASEMSSQGFQKDTESPIFNNPAIMKQFKDNPQLIESIQNDKLKAQLKKKLSEIKPSEKYVQPEEAKRQYLEGN